MSNVIQFLEALGREPMSSESYANAVRSLDVDDVMREALLRKDHEALSNLLGARHNLMMILVPAEDEPSRDEPPADDDEIKALRQAGSRV